MERPERRTKRSPRARILRAWSLCDADCEEGYHNPNHTHCDRCRASIHVRIYEVITESGEDLTVGRECLKEVLGYLPGPWHDKAPQVAERIAKVAAIQEGARIRAGLNGAKLAVVDLGRAEELWIRVPHRLSDTLLRAGADLGVWTYPYDEKAPWGKGLVTWVEWIGI